jgi:hypothetical protein
MWHGSFLAMEENIGCQPRAASRAGSPAVNRSRFSVDEVWPCSSGASIAATWQLVERFPMARVAVHRRTEVSCQRHARSRLSRTSDRRELAPRGGDSDPRVRPHERGASAWEAFAQSTGSRTSIRHLECTVATPPTRSFHIAASRTNLEESRGDARSSGKAAMGGARVGATVCSPLPKPHNADKSLLWVPAPFVLPKTPGICHRSGHALVSSLGSGLGARPGGLLRKDRRHCR